MKTRTIRFWILWRKLKSLFMPGTASTDFFITNYRPDPEEFMRRLIPLCYQYNYWSLNYKDQVCNMRRQYIDENGQTWQYHLRLFKHSTVTGHNELSYEQDTISHIQGRGLTEIPQDEKDRIIEALKTNRR